MAKMTIEPGANQLRTAQCSSVIVCSSWGLMIPWSVQPASVNEVSIRLIHYPFLKLVLYRTLAFFLPHRSCFFKTGKKVSHLGTKRAVYPQSGHEPFGGKGLIVALVDNGRCGDELLGTVEGLPKRR